MCPHFIQKHKHSMVSCPDHAVSVFGFVTVAPSLIFPRSSPGRSHPSGECHQCGGKGIGDLASIYGIPREIIRCKQSTTISVVQHNTVPFPPRPLLLCLLSKLYAAGLSSMTYLSLSLFLSLSHFRRQNSRTYCSTTVPRPHRRSCVCITFFGVTFVLFCFNFVFMLSLKPRPFFQPSFDMRAPR